MTNKECIEKNPCFAGSPDTPETIDTGEWKTVPYQVNTQNGDLIIDNHVAPFDGNPVLLNTSCGMVEAVWVPEERHHGMDGDEWEGFCFISIDGGLHELTEVGLWMPAPEKESAVYHKNPEDEQNRLVLMRVNDKDQPAWVEACYDQHPDEDSGLCLWRALDNQFTIPQESVLGYRELPFLNAEIIQALRDFESSEVLNGDDEETRQAPHDLLNDRF